MASLQLKLLGGFVAGNSTGRPIEIAGRKNQALLAYLALSQGKKVSREKLVGLLWSDRGEAQARSSLRQALLTLRRDLEGLDPPPLVFDGDAIAVDGSAVSTDVAKLERLADSTVMDDLRQAAQVYGGDLLEGIVVRDSSFEEWLSAERTRLRELAIGVLDRLVAESVAPEAVATANRMISLDPLREASYRALMRAFANQGQRDKALRQYEACRNILRRELNVEPSMETAILYREISEGKYQPPAKDAPRGAATGDTPLPLETPSSLGFKPSIMVLPLTNISGDQEQEYFSDGITEDIITDLSQVSALFVVARNTAFTFKGKPVDIVQAARKLNVQYVLEGSVRKAGGRVRITVQLTDGATGGHLWAERYDREFDDIFALQDDISKKVVTALKVKLLPKELKAIQARSTANPEAYELCLQARSIFAHSWDDKAALRSARKLFGKALEIDPQYAKASAGMADCDAYLWVRGDLDISYEAMLSNSSRAVELAPDLAEAHSSRGLALFMAGHAQDADAEFERAIKLDNELYAAHLFYGYSCRDQGKFEKAAELLERAAQLSPSDIWALGVLPDVYNALGRPEQNRAAARRLIIRVEAALSRRPDSADELAMGAASLVDLGENQRAEEWANRALSLDPDSYSVRYNAAGAFAVIGRSGMALDCLEYIFAHMPRTRQWVRRMVSKDTQFHSLRSDPRYKMLMESAGAERKNAD